ncbi:MAG: glycine cleavage system protein GcvH [Phycisphaerales bacterium]
MDTPKTPTDRVYTQSHEWHKLAGDTLTIGLTQYAVDQLTDVTYVEMKAPETKIGAEEVVGEVESVKTTSDVYSAIAGVIIEVNTDLENDPGRVNTDPYGQGWLVRLRVDDPSGLDKLMDAEKYDAQYPSR